MSVYEVPLTDLMGQPFDPAHLRGRAALIVNVASQCGLTPQYEVLQQLYARYRDRGLVVVGVPCDQFGGQEPGTAEEIAEFCSSSYSVTFPLTQKADVNGPARHPLFAQLTRTPDEAGIAGDVQWNFEKFVVSPRGKVVARFRPMTPPDDDAVIAAIEANLPERPAPTWRKRAASAIRPGDRVIAEGTELTVSRVETSFLGLDDLICLIEDTPVRWLAQPVDADAEVDVLS